jgi:hypothetical protein
MKRRLLSFIAAVALATPLVGIAGAGAKTPEYGGQIIGAVRYDRSDPTTATVTARYLCSGDWHLWVSVKQTADGTRDAQLEGPESSQYADTWLQRHPDPSCTGKWTVGTFTVDLSEYGIDGGGLVNGEGWVQFCLTQEPEGSGGFWMDKQWVQVRGH